MTAERTITGTSTKPESSTTAWANGRARRCALRRADGAGDRKLSHQFGLRLQRPFIRALGLIKAARHV